ncbi:MAG: ATP-binding cassette protein [Actinomycetota bacterium]|nr:ATP-binding cassette protein [Actinomycetota bacterium]
MSDDGECGEAIRATGLAKRFGAAGRSVEAVSDLTVSVARGERVAYIGPNGAGKSTSIKILTGILRPTAGSARVLGLVPWRERRRLAARIGTLFGQRSQLWPDLTARQSFTMLAAIYGLGSAKERLRVAELGELLGATELFDAPVRQLSLGQRMRCELAACLLHDPEILFLDEPTIGLDLLAKQRLRDLLVHLNGTCGTTVFLTSHDVADIEHVAERVVIINAGRVIHDGAVAALRRDLLATKLVDVGLAGPAPTIDLPGVEVVEHNDTVLRLAVDTASVSIRAVLDTVLDRCEVSDISVVDPPLEQVIARVYTASSAGAPEDASTGSSGPVELPATDPVRVGRQG